MGVESVKLNIFSLNVNGIGDSINRKAVFHQLLKKKLKKGPGIFLLQGVHGTSSLEDKFRKQWGFKNIIFSHGT